MLLFHAFSVVFKKLLEANAKAIAELQTTQNPVDVSRIVGAHPQQGVPSILTSMHINSRADTVQEFEVREVPRVSLSSLELPAVLDDKTLDAATAALAK